MKFSIYHDPLQFAQEVAIVSSKGKLLDYIDVISPDGRPEELWAVVYDYSHNGKLYSNGKTYRTYQHAFAAIGAALDKCNPEHEPINAMWRQGPE